MSCLDWTDFHDSTDPDLQWSIIYNAIIKYLDINCPIRTVTVSKVSDPWVTAETIELINDRSNMIREHRITKDREVLRQIRRIKNRIQRQLENSEGTFVITTLERAEGDPSKFWREVSKLVNPVTKNLIIQLTNDLTGEIIPIEETASYINNYFANIGSDLFSKLPPTGLLIPDPDLAAADDEDDLDLTALVSHDLVLSLIKKINIDKSCGLEGVNSKVLKDAMLHLCNEMVIIFRNSINEGIFPVSWSCGTLVPIPKKGNLGLIKNWRPITLLPLPGKLLEKIIHSLLSEYLESTDFFCKTQFGFRKNKGTSDAVFHVAKDLFDARDDGKVTAACYIDFCKAFDSVHHPTLLKKICALNIHRKIKKWLMEYLAHRSHCTIANGHKSPSAPVNFGVPQGSILGPLLFILFINDLSDCIQNCEYTMYADDVIIYTSADSHLEASRLLQEDVDRVGSWCQVNGMTINAQKSMCMFFGSDSKLSGTGAPSIFLNDNELPTCESYPYLGVELDQHLSLTPHINKVKKSLGNKVYKLSKLRKNMTKKISLEIYKVMIAPTLEYCSFFIGSAHSAELLKLQRMQNHALRICLNTRVRGTSVADLHTLAEIDTLERRRKIQLLLIMWKLGHGGEAIIPVRVRTRGDLKIRFRKKRAKTSFYQKSPYYRGVSLWDTLDKDVQKLGTRDSFREKIVTLPLPLP